MENISRGAKDIEYDGTTGKLSITFHPGGIKTLADELAPHATEVIA